MSGSDSTPNNGAVSRVPAAVSSVPAAVSSVTAAVSSVTAAVESVPAVVESVPAAVESVPVAVARVPTAVSSVTVAVSSVTAAVESVPAAVESVPAAVSSATVAVSSVTAAVSSVTAAVSSVTAAVESVPAAVESVPAAVSRLPAVCASDTARVCRCKRRRVLLRRRLRQQAPHSRLRQPQLSRRRSLAHTSDKGVQKNALRIRINFSELKNVPVKIMNEYSSLLSKLTAGESSQTSDSSTTQTHLPIKPISTCLDYIKRDPNRRFYLAALLKDSSAEERDFAIRESGSRSRRCEIKSTIEIIELKDEENTNNLQIIEIEDEQSTNKLHIIEIEDEQSTNKVQIIEIEDEESSNKLQNRITATSTEKGNSLNEKTTSANSDGSGDEVKIIEVHNDEITNEIKNPIALLSNTVTGDSEMNECECVSSDSNIVIDEKILKNASKKTSNNNCTNLELFMRNFSSDSSVSVTDKSDKISSVISHPIDSSSDKSSDTTSFTDSYLKNKDSFIKFFSYKDSSGAKIVKENVGRYEIVSKNVSTRMTFKKLLKKTETDVNDSKTTTKTIETINNNADLDQISTENFCIDNLTQQKSSNSVSEAKSSNYYVEYDVVKSKQKREALKRITFSDYKKRKLLKNENQLPQTTQKQEMCENLQASNVKLTVAPNSIESLLAISPITFPGKFEPHEDAAKPEMVEPPTVPDLIPYRHASSAMLPLPKKNIDKDIVSRTKPSIQLSDMFSQLSSGKPTSTRSTLSLPSGKIIVPSNNKLKIQSINAILHQQQTKNSSPMKGKNTAEVSTYTDDNSNDINRLVDLLKSDNNKNPTIHSASGSKQQQQLELININHGLEKFVQNVMTVLPEQTKKVSSAPKLSMKLRSNSLQETQKKEPTIPPESLNDNKAYFTLTPGSQIASPDTRDQITAESNVNKDLRVIQPVRTMPVLSEQEVLGNKSPLHFDSPAHTDQIVQTLSDCLAQKDSQLALPVYTQTRRILTPPPPTPATQALLTQISPLVQPAPPSPSDHAVSVLWKKGILRDYRESGRVPQIPVRSHSQVNLPYHHTYGHPSNVSHVNPDTNDNQAELTITAQNINSIKPESQIKPPNVPRQIAAKSYINKDPRGIQPARNMFGEQKMLGQINPPYFPQTVMSPAHHDQITQTPPHRPAKKYIQPTLAPFTHTIRGIFSPPPPPPPRAPRAQSMRLRPPQLPDYGTRFPHNRGRPRGNLRPARIPLIPTGPFSQANMPCYPAYDYPRNAPQINQHNTSFRCQSPYNMNTMFSSSPQWEMYYNLMHGENMNFMQIIQDQRHNQTLRTVAEGSTQAMQQEHPWQ